MANNSNGMSIDYVCWTVPADPDDLDEKLYDMSKTPPTTLRTIPMKKRRTPPTTPSESYAESSSESFSESSSESSSDESSKKKNKSFKCCGRIFSNKRALGAHVGRCHAAKKLTTLHTFPWKTLQTPQHNMSMEIPPKVTLFKAGKEKYSDMFPCTICKQKCKSSLGIQIHMSRIHPAIFCKLPKKPRCLIANSKENPPMNSEVNSEVNPSRIFRNSPVTLAEWKAYRHARKEHVKKAIITNVTTTATATATAIEN